MASIRTGVFRLLALAASLALVPQAGRAAERTAHTFIGVYGNYDFTTLPQRGLSGGSVLVARWEPPKNSWVAVSRACATPVARSEAAK